MASKQSSRSNPKQQTFSKSKAAATKEESEDEEEGRASAFQSKRRKTEKPKLKPEDNDQVEDVGDNSEDDLSTSISQQNSRNRVIRQDGASEDEAITSN